MAKSTKDLSNVPAPDLPARGRTSQWAGKTFIANPHLAGRNPRQGGSHGASVHALIAEAGETGIGYEALKAAVAEREDIKGFSNHLKWDLDRKFILVLEDL